MAKYRKKPLIIEAIIWIKMGDHPQVKSFYLLKSTLVGNRQVCQICNTRYLNHGVIETLEGNHIVCPGDYIITGIKNEHYPCKPDIFEASYELVENEEK
jgi:hypothetical protein